MKKTYESFSLEQQLIAGCLKNQDAYYEICQFVTCDDFVANGGRVHRTLFQLISNSYEKSEPINTTILAQKLTDLRITFEDGFTPYEYVYSLSLKNISKEATIQIAREVKLLSAKRDIVKGADEVIERIAKLPPTAGISDIINVADQTFNQKITNYTSSSAVPVNIYEDIEAVVEYRAANPITDFGPVLPEFNRLNYMYGSLWIPGHITVIVARPGVGKTTLAFEWNTMIGEKYGIPVLHFDNGEMSLEEVQFRQVSCLSGVSLYYIQTGAWARDPVMAASVRAVWPKVKKMQFWYYDVGGMSVDELINVARRFYFNKVGRGNKMILSYDYIKTGSESFGKKDEHQVVGDMMEKFKHFVKTEIVFDNKPMISMFTSVQQNRYGEADSEGAISLSDRIKQIVSHVFFLRRKTPDEIMCHGDKFGTHVLTNDKSRNMGEGVARAQAKVKMPDGSISDNKIFLTIENFSSKEVCDLKDWATSVMEGPEAL